MSTATTHIQTLEAELESLKRRVAELERALPAPVDRTTGEYLLTHVAGRAKDHEASQEIAKLGKEYRDSLRPRD